MRALTTTSSVLRVVCDTDADLDCLVSSVDLTLSTGDVDAYDVGWFTDDLIPPTASAPPVTPRTPRKWAIGSLRILATGRVR